MYFVRACNKSRKQSQRHLLGMVRKQTHKRIYDIPVLALWPFERSFVLIYNKVMEIDKTLYQDIRIGTLRRHGSALARQTDRELS
jgi:hypothetical protein